jgi:dynein heavy chain
MSRHIYFLRHERALKEYNEMQEKYRSPEKAPQITYPIRQMRISDTMSKDYQAKVNYQFMKQCVQSAPITPIQPEWFENILKMVPAQLKKSKAMKDYINEIFEEVKVDYEQSMKKSMIQLALIKPDVKGLEDEEIEPPPKESKGLDYSSPWHQKFLDAREEIKRNLHILHPSMPLVLNMCQNTLGTMVLFDIQAYAVQGPMEFDHLHEKIINDLEKTEERLMHSWYPNIINVFADKTKFKTIKSEKMDSFFNAVTTLISNQLKDLLVRTIRSWVEAFEVSENNKKLPTLKMELTFDDEKMQFYPPYQDLQELITLLITQVT